MGLGGAHKETTLAAAAQRSCLRGRCTSRVRLYHRARNNVHRVRRARTHMALFLYLFFFFFIIIFSLAAGHPTLLPTPRSSVRRKICPRDCSGARVCNIAAAGGRTGDRARWRGVNSRGRGDEGEEEENNNTINSRARRRRR